MSNGRRDRYFWCLRHQRVETDAHRCPAIELLGPYGSPEEAENALERVRQRNEEWDAEDTRWADEEAT
ncbi:MAG TPA: hypothetical protein VF174_14585 [Micromonosporaceae bacterium]